MSSLVNKTVDGFRDRILRRFVNDSIDGYYLWTTKSGCFQEELTGNRVSLLNININIDNYQISMNEDRDNLWIISSMIITNNEG